MIYTFDTEFIDCGHKLEPISLALVSEDGHRLYVENADVDWELDFDGWHLRNTVPHLRGNGVPLDHMRQSVVGFVGYKAPEFWGYVCAYDWVVLCGLFGRMIDRPDNWPSYAHDLKPRARRIGCADKPIPEGNAHDCLADALGNMTFLRKLEALEQAARGN